MLQVPFTIRGFLWGHVKMRIPSLLALMALVGFLLIELVSWVVA